MTRVVFQTTNFQLPTNGTRMIREDLDFSLASPQVINFQTEQMENKIGNIQSVFIDNSANSVPFALTVVSVGITLRAAPYTQGWYECNVPVEAGAEFIAAMQVGEDRAVSLLFANVPQPYSVWYAGSAIPWQPSVPRGPTTDYSGAIAVGGTSQQAVPSNADRKSLIIENPATATGQNIGAAESLFVNFTDPAGVDDGTSFEITPGGYLPLPLGCPTDAVNVNAATTNHRYIIREI